MSDKPRVRQMPIISDSVRCLITWRGVSKMARVVNYQQKLSSEEISARLTYQVNQLIRQIERELS